MNALAMVVFAVCAAVTVYIYFGYPALIYLLAKVRPRPIARAEVEPSMTLIVPLYNEEQFVERKIRNSLAVDYPREKLQLLFIADGCTDATEEICRRHEDETVRLIALPRGGKAAALNAGAAAAHGEILVFTDANVDLAPDALRVMARCFADPHVGGVSGKKEIRRAPRR